jgi:putative heme-binding domain-containing protein
LQKISRHVLEQDGSTFRTKDFDFLVSDNKDFHPTDVIEDADGSLLVIDTGGWYKLCCPTSQLVKPDVLGAIYRIRRTGAPRIEDPRGLKLDWPGRKLDRNDEELTKLVVDLTKRLGDHRQAVRQRAVKELGAFGSQAEYELGRLLTAKPPKAASVRRNAVWALARGGFTPRVAFEDPDETVRQAALHAASVWRDSRTVPQLLKIVKTGTPHIRRAAAEALGRIRSEESGIPRSSVVASLLEALENPVDQCLEHSLIYALIELGDHEEITKGLTSKNANVRRGALIALDQMENSKLQPSPFADALSAADPKLRAAAWWIASRHPEWGPELGKFLQARLAAKNLKDGERTDLANQLAKLGRSPAIQAVLAEHLRSAETTADGRRLVLKAMARARLKETPAGWLAAFEQIVAYSKDTELLRETLVTIRSLPPYKKLPVSLTTSLAKLAQDEKQPTDVILYALAIVPTKLSSAQFALVQKEIKADRPVVNRTLAAEVFSQAPLEKEQLLELVRTLPEVGPMELERVLEAFNQSSDDQVGRSLLSTLEKLPARTTLRPERLKLHLAKYSPAIREQAEKLYAALDAEAGNQQARLEKLLVDLEKEKGDVRRGQTVFNNQKNACVSCHAIGYLGGNVGPDLTHIGRIRSDRDLVEAIVFPSASFVRSYEPIQVTTKAGKVYNGILRRDDPQEVMLVLGANQEVVIPRVDIDEMNPGRVSIMPSGLEQQLTPRDLADLVAFLRACK